MTIREMLEAHPAPTIGDLDALVRCIEACGDCAVVCTSCADADLGEGEVQEMVRCIRRCLDCADVCDATARIVARQTAPDVSVVRAALEAAWRRAAPVVRSASATPSITSTAASAPRCAAAASRHARTCSR